MRGRASSEGPGRLSSYLAQKCLRITTGNQWFISFMTRAELLMWPRVNRWDSRRREELIHYIDLCTTLLPDEDTCVFWADTMTDRRSAGRPLTTADAWVHLDGLNTDSYFGLDRRLG